MADISAWVAMRNVLVAGGNLFKMTATTAVKAGMLVAIHATGVSGAVDKAVAAAGSMPIGVAMYDAAAGAEVAIAGIGCIVNMQNADDTTGIDAGDYVEANDNAVGGTISACPVAAIAGAVGTGHYGVIGIALDDIAGGGIGRVLITGPGCVVQLNNA